MNRAIMQQALDALNTCDWDYDSDESPHKTFDEDLVNAAAAALKEALAEPEQEPVCDKDPFYCWSIRCQVGKVCKHAAQPEQESISTNDHLCAMLRQVHDVLACTALPMKRQWVELTEEEIATIFFHFANKGVVELTRVIEANFKRKNNA